MANRRGVAICLLTALGFAGPALADGDDFFQRSNTPLTSQLIFMGTVKDDAGNRLSGVLVTWAATFMDGESEDSTFAGTYTDLMGRFRTVDVAHVVQLYGAALNPTRVDVTVAKPGYTLTRRLTRARHDQHMGLVEINFEMKKNVAE